MKFQLCSQDVRALADMKKDMKGPVLLSIHDSYFFSLELFQNFN